MKKKVLMIAKGFEKTGVSSVILSYIDNINSERFAVDVLTGDSYALDYKRHIEKKGRKFIILANRDKNIIKYIVSLAKIIKQERYDIVHVHGNSSMIFPELLGARLGGCRVRIAHSHNTTCNHVALNRICKPIFNSLYTHRVACGKDAGKWMFENKDFTVIPNGIDDRKYVFFSDTREKTRLELGVHKGDILLGHIGCFNYQKNQLFLISMMEKLIKRNSCIKLLLVGDGENFTDIKKKVEEKKLNGNVIMYGLSNEVPSLLMAMDIFLLPSRFEGLPCVLVEAQVSGLPCIVSENVSFEAKMSDNYCSLPIGENHIDIWLDQVLKYTQFEREQLIQANISKIRERGYIIFECIELLEKVYTDALADSGRRYVDGNIERCSEDI